MLVVWIGIALGSAGPPAADTIAKALADSDLTARALDALDDAGLDALARELDDAEGRSPWAPATTELRRRLLTALAERDPEYADDVAELGGALSRLGDVADGDELLGWYVSGRGRGAILRFERARLAERRPEDARAAAELAVDAWRRGELEHTEAMARLEWAARLDDGHHDTWMDLAQLLGSSYEPRAVLTAAEAALRTAPDEGSRADALFEIGAAREALDQYVAAIEAFEQRDVILVAARESRPTDDELARKQITNDLRLAGLHRAHRSVSDALPHLERVLATAEAFGARQSDDEYWPRQVAFVHERLADIHAAMGDLERARDALRRGLAVARRLVDEEADDWKRSLLSRIQFDLATLAMRQGRFDEAREAYDASIATRAALAEDDAEDDERARVLAVQRAFRAHLDVEIGRLDAGARALRDAYEALRVIALDNPTIPAWTWGLLDFARWLEDAEERVGRNESAARLREAIARIEAARVEREADHEVLPDSLEWSDTDVLARRADAAAAREAWAEAIASREQALDLFGRIRATDPNNVEIDVAILEQRAALVDLLEARGELSRAAREATGIRDAWIGLAERVRGDVDIAAALAEAAYRLGEIQRARGRAAQAEAAFRLSMDAWRSLHALDERVMRWKEGLAEAERALSR